MMDEKTQKDLILDSLSMDNSLFMLQEKGEGLKCNTPELQKKNLFDVAKTTVDKVKSTVKVKRQDFINMVYTSHEASPNENIEKYECCFCSISSLLCINSLTKHIIQFFLYLANVHYRNLKIQ